jgi:hypothetical protein
MASVSRSVKGLCQMAGASRDFGLAHAQLGLLTAAKVHMLIEDYDAAIDRLEEQSIEHELGAGGMATVYLAENLKQHFA